MATVPLPARFQKARAAGRIDAEQLELYDRFGIEVPFNRIGRRALRCLRISAHVYNTPAEYNYLADAVEALGKK